jgi:hypothetical protein
MLSGDPKRPGDRISGSTKIFNVDNEQRLSGTALEGSSTEGLLNEVHEQQTETAADGATNVGADHHVEKRRLQDSFTNVEVRYSTELDGSKSAV